MRIRASRRRPHPAAVALVAIMLVASFGFVLSALVVPPAGSLLRPRPSTVATSTPFAGGGAPGTAAPTIPGLDVGDADSIPLERPEFPYLGTASWQIATASGPGHVIEGFASRPSYLPGEVLHLAVSTSGASYAVRLFRLSGRVSTTSPFSQVGSISHQAGRLQPPAVVDANTRMVHAPWTYTTTFRIPRSWQSGIYLARLDSDQGAQSYVPFVVRSRTPARFLVVSSALNWQAYNAWGGSSLYTTTVGSPIPGVTRALAVSFDRPYLYDGGAGQLFFLELPFVAWLQRQGFDLAFTTDYDLSINPDAQALPRAVIFNGHSEYWGLPLRRWLERHVLSQADMGLGVFAADTGYWPVSFSAARSDGPRTVTCYKNGPAPSASAGAGRTPGPGGSSGQGGSPPAGNEDEVAPGVTSEETGNLPLASLGADGPYIGRMGTQPLFGVDYEHVTTAMGAYTMVDSGPGDAFVVGTRLSARSFLGFFAGGEVDRVYPDAAHWGPLGGRFDHVVAVANNIPARNGDAATAQAVYRSLPTGARVFSAATFYWGWALDPAFAVRHDVSPELPRLTRNILEFLATPPALHHERQ